MSLTAVKILGIQVSTSPKKEILKYIEKSLDKPLIIVTPNPEQVVFAQGDKRFANILNQADIAIPDGIGVAHALHIEKIAGVELMEDLVQLAARRSIPIALIGGFGDLAVKTFECLSRKYPGLKGWGEVAPIIQLSKFDDIDEFAQKISKRIQKTGIGMVFVGLGAPKQEYLIERLRQSLVTSNQSSVISKKNSDYGLRITDYPVILMSVGGSFDIITGRTPRAPQVMRSLGLEWLWRLVREPWRLKRQLALVKFAWLLLKEKIQTL